MWPECSVKTQHIYGDHSWRKFTITRVKRVVYKEMYGKATLNGCSIHPISRTERI